MRSNKFPALVVFLSLAIVPHVLSATNQSTTSLKLLGTSKIGSRASSAGTENGFEFRVGPDVDKNFNKQISGSILLTRQGNGHTSYDASTCAHQAEDAYLIALTVPATGTVCSS